MRWSRVRRFRLSTSSLSCMNDSKVSKAESGCSTVRHENHVTSPDPTSQAKRSWTSTFSNLFPATYAVYITFAGSAWRRKGAGRRGSCQGDTVTALTSSNTSSVVRGITGINRMHGSDKAIRKLRKGLILTINNSVHLSPYNYNALLPHLS